MLHFLMSFIHNVCLQAAVVKSKPARALQQQLLTSADTLQGIGLHHLVLLQLLLLLPLQEARQS